MIISEDYLIEHACNFEKLAIWKNGDIVMAAANNPDDKKLCSIFLREPKKNHYAHHHLNKELTTELRDAITKILEEME